MSATTVEAAAPTPTPAQSDPEIEVLQENIKCDGEKRCLDGFYCTRYPAVVEQDMTVNVQECYPCLDNSNFGCQDDSLAVDNCTVVCGAFMPDGNEPALKEVPTITECDDDQRDLCGACPGDGANDTCALTIITLAVMTRHQADSQACGLLCAVFLRYGFRPCFLAYRCLSFSVAPFGAFWCRQLPAA